MNKYLIWTFFGVSIVANLIGAYFVYHKVFTDKKPAPWSSKKIIFLGDSRVHGVNWHRELKRRDVVNAGMPGITTLQLTNKLDSILECRQPERAYIQIGINDIRKSVPFDSTMQAYSVLISELRRLSIQPVIVSVISLRKDFVQDHLPDNVINEQVVKMNEALRSMATREMVAYVDVNTPLTETGRLKLEYTFDGIHLNETGNRIFAESISNSAKGQLNKWPYFEGL